MSFSIDMKDAGAAFEQGVQAPTATEYGAAAQGLQALSKGVFSIADTVARQQRTGPTQTSVDRASFANFISTLQEKTRGVDDLDQLSSVTNGLLTQFISTSGQKPDAAMFDAIKAVTGLDKTTITFNAETAGYNEVIDKVMNNREFLFLAETKLKAAGVDYSNTDITNTAIELLKINEASLASITLTKNISEADFISTKAPQIEERIKDLTILAGAALEIERQGGNVDPAFIQNKLLSAVALLEANFAKPMNVSNETYQPIKNQIDGLKALVNAVSKYDTDQFEALKGQHLAALGTIIVENAKGLNDPVLAASIIQMDPSSMSAYLAQKVTEGIDFLKNIPAEAIVYTEVKIPTSEVANIERRSETSIPDEASIFDKGTMDHAADLKDKTYKGAIDYFINTQVNAATVEAMSVEAHRESFLQGIGKATTYIHSRDSIRDMKFIRTLYSTETLNKLNAIKDIDPEGYTIAVARLKRSLFKQYVNRSLQQSGTLKDSPWGISTETGEITFIPQAEKYGGAEGIAMITQYANEHYEGDLTAMAKDGGARGLTSPMADKYIMKPLLGELTKAKVLFNDAKRELDINNFFKRQLEQLGMSKTGVDKTFNRETSEQNPYVPPSPILQDLDFLQAIDDLSFELGAIPQDLLRVIHKETGGTFDPAEKSGVSSATGLIQFLRLTAKDLGTSVEELAGMTRVEQVEYVGKYLKQKLKGVEDPDLGDLYMAVLKPTAVGKPNDYILFKQKNPDLTDKTDPYNANYGLDVNKDKVITKGEAVERLIIDTSNQDFSRKPIPVTQQELDTEIPRPQVRPDTEQQALPIISQADFYDDDVKRYVESMKADPDTTVIIEGRKEFERMREQGMFKKGQIVVVRLEDGDLETHRIN